MVSPRARQLLLSLPSRVARFLAAAVVAATLVATNGAIAAQASSGRDETAPPPRLSVEAFGNSASGGGGGLRVYWSPLIAVSVALESEQRAGAAGQVRAGVVVISSRPFYEWQMYASGGATYRIPEAGPVASGSWTAHLQVGAQFEIFFAEYAVEVHRNPEAVFRYGVRVII